MFSPTRIVVCDGVKNEPARKDNNKEKPKMNMQKQTWRAAGRDSTQHVKGYEP